MLLGYGGFWKNRMLKLVGTCVLFVIPVLGLFGSMLANAMRRGGNKKHLYVPVALFFSFCFASLFHDSELADSLENELF